MTDGILRQPKLPLTLRFLSDVTKSGQGQAQQGILSPADYARPVPLAVGSLDGGRGQWESGQSVHASQIR